MMLQMRCFIPNAFIPRHYEYKYNFVNFVHTAIQQSLLRSTKATVEFGLLPPRQYGHLTNTVAHAQSQMISYCKKNRILVP